MPAHGLWFALICRGYFTAAFWYAEEGSLPVALWDGIGVIPGTFERAGGMALLIARMAVLFRAK